LCPRLTTNYQMRPNPARWGLQSLMIQFLRLARLARLPHLLSLPHPWRSLWSIPTCLEEDVAHYSTETFQQD
ncbi:hypothetical protein FBU31_004833, partial [Coemansia sp. 'formosensis']